MGDPAVLLVEIDGRAATVGSLWSALVGGYGHFTAMQVRGREVRGLDLHLSRLEEGSHVLLGAELDGGRVRELIRHALGDDIRDASVRVNVFAAEADAGLSVMVAVREPASMPSAPQSLQSAPYQRPLAHIKHIGGFGQTYYRRLAQERGYDEALLVGPDGEIAEGSITNIAFAEGDTVVWPDAPALRGISMQVLERELSKAHVPWLRRPVHLADVGSFDGAFITNSRGIAPVGRIDDTLLPTNGALVASVMQVFDEAPWDPI